jgi:hypothetical protein
MGYKHGEMRFRPKRVSDDKLNPLITNLISCLLIVAVFVYVVGRIDRRYQSSWFDQQGLGRHFYRFMLVLIVGLIVLLAGSL